MKKFTVTLEDKISRAILKGMSFNKEYNSVKVKFNRETLTINLDDLPFTMPQEALESDEDVELEGLEVWLAQQVIVDIESKTNPGQFYKQLLPKEAVKLRRKMREAA